MINFLLKEYIENIVHSGYDLLVSVCFCYRSLCVYECPHLYTQTEARGECPGSCSRASHLIPWRQSLTLNLKLD